MEKTETGCFGIVRRLFIALMLLPAPLSALAAGANATAPVASPHGVSGNHQANILPETIERHGAMAQAPLLCHLKSIHLHELGASQGSVHTDLPLPPSTYISAPAMETVVSLTVAWARIPILAPPRFILFGNFRS